MKTIKLVKETPEHLLFLWRHESTDAVIAVLKSKPDTAWTVGDIKNALNVGDPESDIIWTTHRVRAILKSCMKRNNVHNVFQKGSYWWVEKE